MGEPTIPEMLRVGLKAVQEYWEKPEQEQLGAMPEQDQFSDNDRLDTVRIRL